uniref:PSD13 N-terminal domain-containing protein n=1 Tax=Sinocyclocheilus grahami TaxID=75366 RepID=A0A672KK30_SINGR
MKDVIGYLKQQQSKSPTPEMASEWHSLEDLYNRKLWHQLTLKLTVFVLDPYFSKGDTLIQVQYQIRIQQHLHTLEMCCETF